MAVGAVALAQDTAPMPAPPPTPVTPAQNTAAEPSAGPAATLTAQLTPAQLEQLVAPIALYPDPLLAQILMASTYPSAAGERLAAPSWGPPRRSGACWPRAEAGQFVHIGLNLKPFAGFTKLHLINVSESMLSKAHPVVPGWPICSIRVPCAGDLRRARGGTGWRGGDR
jgi:hypothetical protein